MIHPIMRFTSSEVRCFFHPDKRRNPFEQSHVGGGFKGVHRFIVSNLRDRQTPSSPSRSPALPGTPSPCWRRSGSSRLSASTCTLRNRTFTPFPLTGSSCCPSSRHTRRRRACPPAKTRNGASGKTSRRAGRGTGPCWATATGTAPSS